MKKHNTYNDEELYQQIVAELKPGADEYDALMTEGKAPASKGKVVAMHEQHTHSHKRNAFIYKYVAAACIAFAIIGTSISIMMNNNTESSRSVAEVVKPANDNQQSDNTLLALEEAKKPAVAENDEHAESDEHRINPLPAVGASKLNAANTPHKHTKAETSHPSADEAEQEFLYALITEVENRALEEQAEEECLYHSIVEEVTANMSNKSNKPELVL